jgi:hypothetical protein
VNLPPERDLPPAAHTALRERVVAEVGAPPRRRWVPLAAAAAALAVVGGSAVAVGRDRGPDRAPAVTGAPAAPCRADVGRPEVGVTFDDDFGSLVLRAGPRGDIVCAVSPDGAVTLRESAGNGQFSAEPLGREAAALNAFVYGSGGAVGDDGQRLAGLMAAGYVRADVARVVVAWPGWAAVDAAIDGPLYVARVVQPVGTIPPGLLAGTATAYDRDGQELGSVPLTHQAGTDPVTRHRCAAADATATGSGLLARFTDAHGVVVWVGDAKDSTLCEFDERDGVVSEGQLGTMDPAGYLPGRRAAVQPRSWGNGELGPGGPATRHAAGQVRRGVTRLVITWAGAPPVTVPVKGPYWVARVVLPAGDHPVQTPAEVLAYDAAGTLVGRDQILG